MLDVVGEGFVGIDGPVVEAVIFEVDVEGGAGLFIVIAFLGLKKVRETKFDISGNNTYAG